MTHSKSGSWTRFFRLAAARILLPGLMTMEKILKEMETGSTGSWSSGYRYFNQLYQRFHETLMKASDNPFLLDAHQALNIHVQLARFYQDFTDSDQCETCAEHNALYQALRDHDPEAAAKAAETHLKETEVRVFGLIEERPQIFGGR